MKTAPIGSISHGTLRTKDLLLAFANELERLSGNAAIPPIVEEARGYAEEDSESEAALEVLQDLSDNYLSEFAPPYCYFGAHEGDGSDFGFWPCLDQIEALHTVDGSDEAIAYGDDCKSVNDHGNVTVYSGTGEVLLELV